MILILTVFVNLIHGIAGFYFIPEALNKAEQLYWATECLTTFPQPPNRTNHNAMYGPIANLWAAFQENKILVEVASGKQERDLISNSAETRSVDEKISDSIESVRAEVSDDITVVEKNRFHDNGITTSGGGNALKCNKSGHMCVTAQIMCFLCFLNT